jgi:hypothetical protein
MVEACTGLAVPGRPIGPWSQRTGAPEDVRDRDGTGPSVRTGSVVHRDYRGTG